MDFWTWITQLFKPRPDPGRSDGSHFSTAASYSRDDGRDVFGDSYFNCDKGSDIAQADSGSCSDSGDAGGGGDGGGSD